jgi:hypothetical protein
VVNSGALPHGSSSRAATILLALKGNQGTLHEAVRLHLDDPAHGAGGYDAYSLLAALGRDCVGALSKTNTCVCS